LFVCLRVIEHILVCAFCVTSKEYIVLEPCFFLVHFGSVFIM